MGDALMVSSLSPQVPPAGPLDLELIRKYAVPGPRYTSYPPATQFGTDLVRLGLDEAIRDDNRDSARPLSLYFHLPFCESLCWFCGCNTVITRQRDVAGTYLDDVARELELVARQVDAARPVGQIHLGGGTPTFLAPPELRRLGTLIERSFPVRAADCEFSAEVDPRRLTRDHVAALRAIGINRASLGIQDTNPAVQLAIHRIQPPAANRQAFAWLRAEGIGSINVDLIYGLPLQTAETFAATIDDVLTLDPDRLSVFAYAHVPWMKPAQRLLGDRQEIPGAGQRLAMFAVARERLGAAGYAEIGLDHFARPDDELALAQRHGTMHRNFQGYSTRGGASLYSFGMSAISSTADVYWQNFKTLPEWRAALHAGRLPVERGLRLTAEDRRRRTIIMRLMCDRRLDFPVLSAALGVDFASQYAAELASLTDLEADGIVTRTSGCVEVTALGTPLLRIVAMRFDPHVSASGGRHSRAI